MTDTRDPSGRMQSETAVVASRVSVIIPAYNAAHYVARAIDSALAQTYEAVEVVVVNDGSTDETHDIVSGYGDRVVYVQQPNRGLAAARNAGLEHATGEYIGLLDADDIWFPERVERCVDALQDDPTLGLVTTDTIIMRDGVPTADLCYGTFRPYSWPAESEHLSSIARENFIFVSVVARRSVFERFGVFDERLRRAEDYDMWARLLLAGVRIGYIDAPLAYYDVREGSLSQAHQQQWDAHLEVLRRHLPALWQRGVHGRPEDSFLIGRQLAQSGDRVAAARFFWETFSRPGLGMRARIRYGADGVRQLTMAPKAKGEGMRIGHLGGRLVRSAAGRAFARVDVNAWPARTAKLFGISVPSAVTPLDVPQPRGNAHVGIVLDLLERTVHVPGDIAECGVFRGATLVPISVQAARLAPGKRVLAFDSFEGFDASVLDDVPRGGLSDDSKKVGGFGETSADLVRTKLGWFGLDDSVELVQGFYADTLTKVPERRYAFVHLDCDIYSSYKECLEYFYPRVERGGIILFDEYNDPTWPGCTEAVDEFMASKPEPLQTIVRDNYVRTFLTKGTS